MEPKPMHPEMEKDVRARLQRHLDELSFELRRLRLTLFCCHQEAFRGKRPMLTFDPARWAGRALDQQAVCMLQAISLYAEADWCFHEGLESLE